MLVISGTQHQKQCGEPYKGHDEEVYKEASPKPRPPFASIIPSSQVIMRVWVQLYYAFIIIERKIDAKNEP